MKLKTVKTWVKSFWTDETGATAIEYAMIAAGISILIIAGVTAIGSSTNQNMESVQDGFN